MYRDPGYGEYRLSENVLDRGSSVLVNTYECPYEECAAQPAYMQAETAVTYEDPQDTGASLTCALRLMEQAAENETQSLKSCRRLADMTGGAVREILLGISNDNEKHFGLLRRIYREITNEALHSPVKAGAGSETAYRPALEQAFLKAQREAADYRSVLFAMRTREHVNMMAEIVTDKLRHLALYNFLLAKAYVVGKNNGR